jgi:hypothetical protein
MLMFGGLNVCGYCKHALQCVLYPADWFGDALTYTTPMINSRTCRRALSM